MHDVRKGIVLGLGNGCAQGVILFGAGFQYMIGGIFYDLEIVDFAEIMRCLLVLIFMAFGFSAISRDAADRVEAMLAAERVHTLVTTESAIDGLQPKGDVPSQRPSGRIELKDVSFEYPARREVTVYDG